MAHRKKAKPVSQDLEPLEPHGFAELDLSPRALAAVKRIGFDEPSEIQQKFIPAALTGRDCVGRARTGTGKTAAFLLPIFEHFFKGEHLYALVIAPTRELAQQIADESERLSGHSLEPRAVACFGGQPIKKQITQLRADPQIVAGTPGRLLDHFERKTITPSRFSIVVLDEVDRMFDMGFRRDIDRILRQCTNRYQTLFLSATMPADVMRLADKYLTDPIRISTVSDNDNPAVETLDQYYFTVAKNRKLPLLLELFKREEPELSLIFTRTKAGADRLYKELKKHDFNVDHIHGDLPQEKRTRAMAKFREGKVKVLVATDLMGRGIDVPGVSHVINYDIPDNAEDYLHRVGRSSRMNAPGKAFTFVIPDQGDLLTNVEMLCNTLMEQDEIEGFDNGVKRKK